MECKVCKYKKLENQFYKSPKGFINKTCLECEAFIRKDRYISKKEILSPNLKRCSKCENIRSNEDFTKNKHGKDGKYSICKSCQNKKYLLNRKENIEKSINCRNKKSDHYRNKRKERYDKKKEELLVGSKIYRENNKENIKKYQKKYYESKRTDSMFRLKRNLRSAIRRYIKGKKSKSTFEILGCSNEEIKLYIESLWEPWMNWNNYASINGTQPRVINECWDIDHIIPISSGTNEEEIMKLNHYTNLQPLCSYINRWIKRNIYE